MNNHMFDQGISGHKQTIALLEKNNEQALDEAPKTVSGITLFALTNLLNPVDSPTGFVQQTRSQTLAALAKPLSTLKVVFIHSGTEYGALTSDSERDLLRSFIDAGADAVIAAHTHVISDMEIYKDKPIFHGIGNFLFDQFDTPETMIAKIVRLRPADRKVLFETWIGK